MKQVLPGIFHWTAMHPKIKFEVSSYYLADEGVLIDPLVPAEGLGWFEEAPQHIFLTNRHHYRDSDKFVAKFGCTVRCVDKGLHEFTRGENVEGFRFGSKLPGGIEAVEIGVLCPDETALWIPQGEGALALADGVVRAGQGPLGFVPDQYLGDDPGAVKDGVKAAYRRLLSREFDHLLLAHGWPWIGGGKQALREFVES